MLEAAVLRSPHPPHARISSIDISAALTVPGVFAVLTGHEVRDACATPATGRLADDPPTSG